MDKIPEIKSFKLTDEEFQKISKLIYDLFGIVLSDKKRTLIIGRLQSELKKRDFGNFQEYYEYVIKDKTGQALLTLIDKISTNHTFFFREADHFEFLKETAFKEMQKQAEAFGEKEIRIWCAGCSSGEEAYTLKLLAQEYLGNKLNGMTIKLLATDISSTALDKAKTGKYSNDNVSNIPQPLLKKYFTKFDDENWIVKDSLKQNMFFNRLNFMSESFPFKKKFHCVFCRNVMIYFDPETRDSLVSRISRYLFRDSFFFIGHSETIGRSNPNFKYIKPALYVRL